jgi:hypothetical protein
MDRKCWLVAGTALVTLAMGGAAFAQEASPSMPVGKPGMHHRMRGERHPEMHRAMMALQNAKRALQHAAHDYAGHRVNAIKHIDEALEEIRLGLQSEKK